MERRKGEKGERGRGRRKGEREGEEGGRKKRAEEREGWKKRGGKKEKEKRSGKKGERGKKQEDRQNRKSRVCVVASLAVHRMVDTTDLPVVPESCASMHLPDMTLVIVPLEL